MCAKKHFTGRRDENEKIIFQYLIYNMKCSIV